MGEDFLSFSSYSVFVKTIFFMFFLVLWAIFYVWTMVLYFLKKGNGFVNNFDNFQIVW